MISCHIFRKDLLQSETAECLLDYIESPDAPSPLSFDSSLMMMMMMTIQMIMARLPSFSDFRLLAKDCCISNGA